MAVDADAAAVDLARAQTHELDEARRHAGLRDGAAERLQGLHRIRKQKGGMLETRGLHFGVSLSHRSCFDRHSYDGTKRGNVTGDKAWLSERFEAQRSRLRGVAYRMLGSLSEAEDAVQESWLRASRAQTSDVENLGGWLTTVVARVSLDMLRSRKSRREESLAEEAAPAKPVAGRPDTVDPEQEALLADSVGLALLVVLENLTPTERLAFVLHDLFGMSFRDISPIVRPSPAAPPPLASRAPPRVPRRG